MDWLPGALPYLLTFLGGSSIAALIVAISTRGKTKADAAAQITDSAMELIVPLREELTALRADVKDLRSDVSVLEGKLQSEERRSWAAIGYIRRLIESHKKHAPEASLPEVPELLSDIV